MLTLRHYGKYRSEEIIILGYNKLLNDVLICRVAALPVDEQMNLRQIAGSLHRQTVDYLVPILQGERHKSNYDWFTYLCTRFARKGDGAVIRLPLKEIEDMHPDQKAVFKGYAKPTLEPTPAELPEIIPAQPDRLVSLLETLVLQNQKILSRLEGNAPAPRARTARKPKTVRARKRAAVVDDVRAS